MGLKVVWRNGHAYAAGTVQGRRIRQSLGTGDPEQAEEARAALEAKAWRQGLYGDEAVRTFEDAALSYLENGGEGRFMAPLIRYFRGVRLASIKPGHVIEAAAKLYPKGTPETRRRQAITPAVAVINHGHLKGWCGAIRVKAPKGRAKHRKAVGRPYIDAVRAACMAHKPRLPHLAALMLFLHQTGARLSEALALAPDDVSLPDATAVAHDTKNGEPRTIYLTAEMVAELRNLEPREGRVFGYVTKNGVYRALRQACTEAGVAYLGTHQPGRHSFATALDAQGFTSAQIAEAGGWKSRALVAQRYTHPEDAGRRAAEAMGAGSAQPKPARGKKRDAP